MLCGSGSTIWSSAASPGAASAHEATSAHSVSGSGSKVIASSAERSKIRLNGTTSRCSPAPERNRCAIGGYHGHGPKACKLAERKQGNEAGKNCDHAHDGMAMARKSAGWMWGGTDEAESVSTILAALEHGINIIDTAPVYGFGRSRRSLAGQSPRSACARACLLPPRPDLNGRMEAYFAMPAAPASCGRSRTRDDRRNR